MSFALKELLKGAAANAPRLKVEGINADSREIRPGEAFFAIPGLKTHGDAFAAQARARGAKVMVTDRAPTEDPGMPVVVVDDVRRVYAQAASRQYAEQPETIVGVTGTNGKSSIVSFVRQIWTACGIEAASVGTVGVETSRGLTPGELTTPDALSLHRSLADLKTMGIDHVAMEASSQGLHQRRVDGIPFAAAAFTNLSRDHLDYHPDMEAYREAKVRLFSDLIAEGGSAVVNVDDENYEPFMFAALGRGVTLMTVGREGAWFEIGTVENEGYGQRVTGRLVGEPVEFHLPLTGSFQASNAVVALGLAMATGAPKKAAIESLSRLKGATGRLELVAEHNGAAIFVDYAHKPVALETALGALRPYARNRLHVVFGAGGDRDKGKRPQMGSVAEAGADRVMVTSDNPRSESPAAIIEAVLGGLVHAEVEPDRALAIRRAVAEAADHDVILLAGKGHEDYQEIGGQRLPFSDLAEAQAALSLRRERTGVAA